MEKFLYFIANGKKSYISIEGMDEDKIMKTFIQPLAFKDLNTASCVVLRDSAKKKYQLIALCNSNRRRQVGTVIAKCAWYDLPNPINVSLNDISDIITGGFTYHETTIRQTIMQPYIHFLNFALPNQEVKDVKRYNFTMPYQYKRKPKDSKTKK